MRSTHVLHMTGRPVLLLLVRLGSVWMPKARPHIATRKEWSKSYEGDGMSGKDVIFKLVVISGFSFLYDHSAKVDQRCLFPTLRVKENKEKRKSGRDARTQSTGRSMRRGFYMTEFRKTEYTVQIWMSRQHFEGECCYVAHTFSSYAANGYGYLCSLERPPYRL